MINNAVRTLISKPGPGRPPTPPDGRGRGSHGPWVPARVAELSPAEGRGTRPRLPRADPAAAVEPLVSQGRTSCVLGHLEVFF